MTHIAHITYGLSVIAFFLSVLTSPHHRHDSRHTIALINKIKQIVQL